MTKKVRIEITIQANANGLENLFLVMTCLDDELVDEIPHGGRLGCGEHDAASSPHNNLEAGALDGGHLRDVLEAVELDHLQCSPHGHLSSNCYRGWSLCLFTDTRPGLDCNYQYHFIARQV